jgi:hypothetical protein
LASICFRPFCDWPSECWRTFRCGGGATISGAGCENPEENPASESGQKTVACAWEATPIAPAAVKAAILHHEFDKERAAEREERSLALNGSSFPVAIEIPSPSARVILDSYRSDLVVAEAKCVHQRKASNSSRFAPSVTKKPHIPLNDAGFRHPAPSGKYGHRA